eukprot:scaffold26854_cov56-Phaeocystis_antarctica.AAC.1
MLCPNSCARVVRRDDLMSDQHAPARGASLGFEQPTRASPPHVQPMMLKPDGRKISMCVYPEAAWPAASATARTSLTIVLPLQVPYVLAALFMLTLTTLPSASGQRSRPKEESWRKRLRLPA